MCARGEGGPGCGAAGEAQASEQRGRGRGGEGGDSGETAALCPHTGLPRVLREEERQATLFT